MKLLKTAIENVKELVKGRVYATKGITEDISGEKYFRTEIDDRIVLYHVSRFKPCAIVSDDEF